MSVYGKRQERLGLHVAPTFGQAISQPLNQVRLPGLKSTEFWNSPAYQGLLNLQQAVETEAELDARRAQLKSLMTRVAHEHHVSITQRAPDGAGRGEGRGLLTSRAATRQRACRPATGTTTTAAARRLRSRPGGGLRARPEPTAARGLRDLRAPRARRALPRT